MALGKLSAIDTSDSQVRVTLKRDLQGDTDYLDVNWVFAAIWGLMGGSKEAWPSEEAYKWLDKQHRVYLFVLVYVVSGCDFLPGIGMGFRKLWKYSLKAVRTEGLFRAPVVVQREGRLRVDINAGLKLLGSAYYFKHEVIFAQVEANPFLKPQEDHDVSRFLFSLAQSIFLVKGSKPNQLCLPERSMVLQLLRADAVLEYWQGAFAETMPVVSFEGRGWGKAPCKKGEQSAGDMTKENIVLHLSDNAYVDTTGKAATITCGCDPEKAPRHRCKSCKCGRSGRKCVMFSCRCKCSCIPALRPLLPAVESDGRRSSGVDTSCGGVCDDFDHGDEDDHFRETANDVDTDTESDHEEDYSYNSYDENGGNVSDTYPHQPWGTGVGGAVGDIGEWDSGEEDNCEGDTNEEAKLAARTAQMLDGLLQESDR